MTFHQREIARILQYHASLPYYALFAASGFNTPTGVARQADNLMGFDDI